MPESLTLSAAKLDAFAKAVNSATPHKLQEMVSHAAGEAADYANPANIRAIYRKIATLLRNELKGWKPNPVKKKTAKKRASNPRKARNTSAGVIIKGSAPGGKTAYVSNNKHPVVKLGLVKTKSSAKVFPSNIAASEAINGPLRGWYPGWHFEIFSSKRRASNPRRSLKKSHLWKVFRIKNGKVDYYGGVGTWGHPDDRRAILFRARADANNALHQFYSSEYQHGVAPENATNAEILESVYGRASSARGK